MGRAIVLSIKGVGKIGLLHGRESNFTTFSHHVQDDYIEVTKNYMYRSQSHLSYFRTFEAFSLYL